MLNYAIGTKDTDMFAMRDQEYNAANSESLRKSIISRKTILELIATVWGVLPSPLPSFF